MASPALPFRSDKLREHVDNLKQPARTIISRHFFGGETLRAISVELGLEESQVRSACRKALVTLKAKVLADDGKP